MLTLLYVGLGGAFGAICRYLLGVASMRTLGSAWPYGTFAANVIGGILMGALVSTLAWRGGADQEKWRLLLGVGVLGGFTTFSSFSLEVVLMIERREWGQAAAYSVASVVLSAAALIGGMLLVRRLVA